MKKRLAAFALALIVSAGSFTALPVSAASNSVYKISRIGKKNRTVYVGKEIELKVKKSERLDDDDLKWRIKDKSILAFDDDDVTDDDVELIGLKAGKTKVYCYNKKTKKSMSFIVTVKKRPVSSSMKRVGKETKKVEVDDDLELKVKDSGTASKYYKWEIKNTNILRFDDNDNTGKEVDLEGIRTGETTVICTNTKTNKKITYTVIVTPEVDD